MIEHLERRLRRVNDVDWSYVSETLRHMFEELFCRAFLEGLLAGVPLIVIKSPHQERQLRAEMDREPDRETVAQGVQDRAEHMPRDLAVGAELGHDFVEPDMGRLQSLVEDVEAGGAHANLHDRTVGLYDRTVGLCEERTLASPVPALRSFRTGKFRQCANRLEVPARFSFRMRLFQRAETVITNGACPRRRSSISSIPCRGSPVRASAMRALKAQKPQLKIRISNRGPVPTITLPPKLPSCLSTSGGSSWRGSIW